MTLDQLRSAIPELERAAKGEGYGMLVTLKSGLQIRGDFHAPQGNGLMMIEPYLDGCHSPNLNNPVTMVEVEEIAAVAMIDFSPNWPAGSKPNDINNSFQALLNLPSGTPDSANA